MDINIKKTETKSERFERLAEKRMAELKKAFRLLSNLASTNNYKYNEKQVDQMIKEIKKCTEELEISYRKRTQNVLESSFSFKP